MFKKYKSKKSIKNCNLTLIFYCNKYTINQFLRYFLRTLKYTWKKQAQKIIIAISQSSKKIKKSPKSSNMLKLLTWHSNISIDLNLFLMRVRKKKMQFMAWKLWTSSLCLMKNYPRLRNSSRTMIILLWTWLGKLWMKKWFSFTTSQGYLKNKRFLKSKISRCQNRKEKKDKNTETCQDRKPRRLWMTISKMRKTLSLYWSIHQNSNTNKALDASSKYTSL